MSTPLNFDYIIDSIDERTKEKQSDTQISLMRADLADTDSVNHLRVVEVDKQLSSGIVSFDDLKREKQDISVDKNTHWSWIFPLSLYKSIDIYDLAQFLPKKIVWSRVFIGGFDLLTEDQKKFADIIYDYGRAVGLEAVGRTLYEGASSGDPRAVKMFLEVCGLLGEEEDDLVARMMQVKIDI